MRPFQIGPHAGKWKSLKHNSSDLNSEFKHKNVSRLGFQFLLVQKLGLTSPIPSSNEQGRAQPRQEKLIRAHGWESAAALCKDAQPGYCKGSIWIISILLEHGNLYDANFYLC